MKTFLSILLFTTAGVAPGFAQWAVLDMAGLQQSVINYSAMTEQIAKQATQISNQVQQIKQFETQLQRLGDMANVHSLVGFTQFRADLSLPTQVKKWADGVAHVDGRNLFGDTRGGIFREIDAQFPDFDGAHVDRDPQVFKEANNLTVTIDEFKAVQSDVYTRRENLKGAIASTSETLQAATTEAEEQKLQAVLNAQYGQLSAVDAEVALSAAQVQVKAAEANAMNSAQNDADAEARGRLAQLESKKLSTAFKPRYECPLQFVTEKSLAP